MDLDGAKSGKVINDKVLQVIASSTKLKIDFGGGIKTDDDLKKVFENGADQVTIGSVAVKEPELFSGWIQTNGPEKIILGADVKDLFIATNGWLETSKLSLFDFLEDYYKKGIRNVLCTDISKDGMLEGPAFELYRKIMEKFRDLQLIASGGISCIEDVKRLKSDGIPAVVIGKAIYENRIDLKELLKITR